MLQGAMLLMMGTADELPKEPVQKTVFMEDMTEQQLASAVRIENLFITKPTNWPVHAAKSQISLGNQSLCLCFKLFYRV